MKSIGLIEKMLLLNRRLTVFNEFRMLKSYTCCRKKLSMAQNHGLNNIYCFSFQTNSISHTNETNLKKTL